MTFAQMNLDPSISKAILACGYDTPTPVQARSIPDILNGSDIVASAQTGTGKTAAFVLPALHRLSSESKNHKPRVLILTPTRELATQITQAAGKYGKFVRFNMASLVGGMPYRQQLRDLSRAVDMIVATPGRLMDHMENRRIDLSGIEMLILDEADRMLDMGFIDDVQAIAKATPKSRQTLLFSATVDAKLSQIVKHLLNNPIRIDLSQEKVSATQIKQELYMVDSPHHKARLLQHFLDNENIFKAIIFSATKIGADRLAGQLREQGYQAAALHGDLKQSQRNRTVEDLRRGKVQFVVATDVAARGIDIADMTHVINYDLPRFCEDYVHRIGRTGRAGKSGIAISFALPSDVRHVASIERFIKTRLEPLTIPGLEPTTKARSNSGSEEPSRRRGKPGHGKSGYGSKSDGGGRSGRGGFGRSEGGRGGKSSFGGRSDDGKPGRGKSSFGRSDDARPARGKSDFSRSDDARPARGKSFGRSDDARPARGKSDFSRSDDSRPARGKSDFSRSDDSRPARGKSSFGRSDDSRPARGKSFGRSDDSRPARGKSDFSRSDDSRPARGKSSFGRSDDSRPARAKSGFGGRSDDSRPARAKSGFGKSDDSRPARSKSGFTRSDDSRPARAKSGFGGRSDDSRPARAKSGFGGRSDDSRPARAKSGFSKSDDSRPSRAKSVRSKSDDGAKPRVGSDKIRYKSKKD